MYVCVKNYKNPVYMCKGIETFCYLHIFFIAYIYIYIYIYILELRKILKKG